MNRLIADISTPVILLGAAHHGGLSFTRSLGRLGIPVFNLDRSTCNPAFFSKYCRGSFVWNLASESAERSIDYLLSTAERIGKPCVLAAITDLGALFIADNADSLSSSFLFPQQNPALSRSLYNKRRMHELAQAAGVPIAASAYPGSREEALGFAESTGYPIMFKATDGIRLAAAGIPTKSIVRSRSQLEKLLSPLQDEDFPDCMLQEYIPGDADSIWMFDGYFDDHSRCRFGVTAQKIRQYPAYIGASSLAICSRNDEVHAQTCDFMQFIGYRGVVDLGYRFDKRDGRYKILDVNPRIGSSFRLFASDTGMDVARALYCGLTGQSIKPGLPCWGRKWLVEDLDVVSALRCIADGNLKVKDWVRSYSGIQETAVWANDDWKGSLGVLLSDLRNLWPRVRKPAHRVSAEVPVNQGPITAGASLPPTTDLHRNARSNS